jgi:diguanylate cyclase (GGDEF)-like protein/PAS domain S-box-containing protein
VEDQDLRRELRRTEQRLRTVLDSAADLVVMLGAEGQLLYTSDRAVRALGYGDDDTVRPILDYIHPDDAVAVQAMLAAALATPGPTAPVAFRLRRADGSWRHMEGAGVNLLDDEDVAALVVGLRDMTARRKAERLNAVLAEANETVLRATDPTELLAAACRIAVELGGLGEAWVTRRGEALVGSASEAAATRATVTDGASLHLPLVVDAAVYGVLSVVAGDDGSFDDDEVHLLERLAGNVAFGLSALAARAAVTQRNRQQDAVARLGELALATGDPDEVADALVGALGDGIGADFVSVLELLPGGDTFRVLTGTGWSDGIIGSTFSARTTRPAAWAVDRRAPLLVDDLADDERFVDVADLVDAGVASGISVPVEVDGRVWGVVAAHSRTPHRFGPDDVSFVQAVGNVLAAAVGRHEAFLRLRHQALHDPLTGLPNRILLEDRLDQAMERHRRGGPPVAVAVVDIDGFRLVNDTLGADAGNDLLRAVARRLWELVGPTDTVARLAADEFAVVRENAGDVDIADAVRAAMAEPVEVGSRRLAVTVTMGTAHAPDADAITGPELLQRALGALHLAKTDGRSRHRRHDSRLEAELAARFELQSDLAQARACNELTLAWQPIVDTASGAVVGGEALLRWHHPTRGLVLPGEFVPLAEDTGLIVDIGRWVLSEACRTLGPWARWAAAEGREFHGSVNLSAAQLSDAGLLDHVAACLEEHGLAPSALRIEITESVLFTERDGSSSMLQQLHDLGVGLVVDDFGTGFSSLSYLHRFPLAGLKIDRTFTATLGSADHHAAAIVEAIIGMATALGLETVAEGVEDDLQRAELLGLGCTYAQGWLFGRPTAPEEFEQLLRASTPPVRRRPSPPRPPRFEETTFRVLLEDAADLVACFDDDLRYLYVNPALERAYGRARAELVGRTSAEVGLPDAERWERVLADVVAGGRPRNVEFDAGGRRYAARVVPQHVDGQVATVSVIARVAADQPQVLHDTALDAVTGLLGRASFMRVAGGLRHRDGERFGVVVARFRDMPAGAGQALQACLRAGDVAARWSADELVVLRHPLDDVRHLDELATDVTAALGPLGVKFVDCASSSDEQPSPVDLLTPRPQGSPVAPGG